MSLYVITYIISLIKRRAIDRITFFNLYTRY